MHCTAGVVTRQHLVRRGPGIAWSRGTRAAGQYQRGKDNDRINGFISVTSKDGGGTVPIRPRGPKGPQAPKVVVIGILWRLVHGPQMK